MVRYFYTWTPLAILATTFLLTAPWLGVIALLVVALAALAALAAFAWALVLLPYTLGRSISHRRHMRGGWKGDPRRGTWS